jgi:hypothetical protein
VRRRALGEESCISLGVLSSQRTSIAQSPIPEEQRRNWQLFAVGELFISTSVAWLTLTLTWTLQVHGPNLSVFYMKGFVEPTRVDIPLWRFRSCPLDSLTDWVDEDRRELPVDPNWASGTHCRRETNQRLTYGGDSATGSGGMRIRDSGREVSCALDGKSITSLTAIVASQ